MHKIHETYTPREKIHTASNKSFGLVFFCVLLLIAIWPLIFGGSGVRIGVLVTAVLLLAITFTKPSLLAPANLIWTYFGRVLHIIINPLVMGLIYFLAVTPTGLILRLLRKDILNLQWDNEVSTYWLPRDPPGPDPDSMSNQF